MNFAVFYRDVLQAMIQFNHLVSLLLLSHSPENLQAVLSVMPRSLAEACSQVTVEAVKANPAFYVVIARRVDGRACCRSRPSPRTTC